MYVQEQAAMSTTQLMESHDIVGGLGYLLISLFKNGTSFAKAENTAELAEMWGESKVNVEIC